MAGKNPDAKECRQGGVTLANAAVWHDLVGVASCAGLERRADEFRGESHFLKNLGDLLMGRRSLAPEVLHVPVGQFHLGFQPAIRKGANVDLHVCVLLSNHAPNLVWLVELLGVPLEPLG